LLADKKEKELYSSMRRVICAGITTTSLNTGGEIQGCVTFGEKGRVSGATEAQLTSNTILRNGGSIPQAAMPKNPLLKARSV